MTIFFKRATLLIWTAVVMGLAACADEDSTIGANVIGSGSQGKVWTSNVLVQNLFYDSLRSDNQVLFGNAVLGSYSDNTLGSVMAKYITQVRLNSLQSPLLSSFRSWEDSLNFQYQVDSVILRIPVVFNTTNNNDDDDNVIDVDTIFLYDADEEDENETGVDTLEIRTRYRLDSIYGNKNTSMTLRVKEVQEFLYNIDTTYYSNPNLRERDQIDVSATEWGSGTIGSEIETITVKAANSPSNQFSESASYKVFLDTNVFESRIVDTYQTIGDQSVFIREIIQGMQLEVDPTNGFLFNFLNQSNSFNIVVYASYSYDRENPTQEQVDENDLTVEGTTFVTLDLSNSQNVKINQFENDYTGSAYMNEYQANQKIFLSGLSGIRSQLTIPEESIQAIQDSIQERSWAIIDAKLKLHVDESYNYPLPRFIYAWHVYEDEEGETQEVLFDDMTTFVNTYPGQVQFNPFYDFTNDPRYYELHITQTFKNLVENNATYNNSRIVLTMGNFILNAGTGGVPVSLNPFINNRAFNPYRLVLKGNDGSDEQLSLEVKYID